MAYYKELTESEVRNILYNSNKNNTEAICYFDEDQVKYVYFTTEEIKEHQKNNLNGK